MPSLFGEATDLLSGVGADGVLLTSKEGYCPRCGSTLLKPTFATSWGVGRQHRLARVDTCASCNARYRLDPRTLYGPLRPAEIIIFVVVVLVIIALVII